MDRSVSVAQVKVLIGNAIDAFPHEYCWTCECFLGYVTQLEIDADQPRHPFFQDYRPPRGQVHSCLGCDPCPPGDHYAQYLHGEQDHSSSQRLDRH